jgi:hypothetical protein
MYKISQLLRLRTSCLWQSLFLVLVDVSIKWNHTTIFHNPYFIAQRINEVLIVTDHKHASAEPLQGPHERLDCLHVQMIGLYSIK